MTLPHKYINNFDNSTKQAVMYLYGDIGYDVNGSYFAQEVDYLVSNGCKKIKVNINSGGGLVIDAYSIFSALYNCPVPVETVNVGIAASAAGWCWLAGNECKMMDYSIFMMHNASGTDGEQDEVSQKFTDSIKKIIASMSNKSEMEIGEMMANETFMDSSQMINCGMLKPENVIVTTKKPKILANDVKGIYAICNQFLTAGQVTQTQKTKNMSKVNSLLKLSNEASEEAVSEALGKVLSDKEALETRLAELQNEVVSLRESLKAYKDAEDAMKATMVAELIENGIKEGKIEDATKEVWSNLAKVDYENAKKALNGLHSKRPAHVNVFDPQKPSTDPRADWTIRDWEQKDPDGLLKMMQENNAEYTRLFNSFYKK